MFGKSQILNVHNLVSKPLHCVFFRHKQFQLKAFCKRKRTNSEIERKSYTYDAFVAYCEEDRFWVHDILRKELEDIYSFRLCLHYRY